MQNESESRTCSVRIYDIVGPGWTPGGGWGGAPLSRFIAPWAQLPTVVLRMSEPAGERDHESGSHGWGMKAGAPGLALLLAIYLVLAGGSAGEKSITVDELGHLPSGLYYLTTGDPRHASLNPPLLNVLSALPVLFLDLERELVAPPASDDVFSFWSTGYQFLDAQRADYLRIYAAARWIPIGVVAGLAILLFVWARSLAPRAPEAAGLLAAGLVLFSPNVLAHARLVGTDTGTAFFVALALFGFRSMLARPTAAFMLLAGLALGFAQLTKFYAILLYPTLLGLTLAWHFLSPDPRPRLGRLLGGFAVAVVVSLVVLNAAYLWTECGVSLSGMTLHSDTLRWWQESALGAVPLPLPAAYLRAFDGQMVEAGSGIPSYLIGESFQGGRWYYYLVVLAIKTPLPLILTFVLAVFFSLRSPHLAAREQLILLAYPVLLCVLLSLGDRRQLGGRSLLSAVPLVELWVAATLANVRPKGWPVALGAGALGALLCISLWSYPDYLAYFNSFVGGSERGYRYASDANVDIGQDLVQLADYLEEADADSVQLLYFGSVDPALYGIDYRVPTGYGLEPGLFAVSVSLYRMSYEVFDHGSLRRMGPVDVAKLGDPIASIGGSIHVYHVKP